MSKNIVVLAVIAIVVAVLGSWFFSVIKSPIAPATAPKSAPPGIGTVSGTVDVVTDSATPTISGTLENMYAGDLTIVVVAGDAALPAQPDDPAAIKGVVASGDSGVGGEVSTDYRQWFSYTVTTPIPAGSYTIGVYYDTRRVRDSAYQGYSLLTSRSFTSD